MSSPRRTTMTAAPSTWPRSGLPSARESTGVPTIKSDPLRLGGSLLMIQIRWFLPRRCFNEVLTHEPNLQLVGANHVTDQEIVRAIIPLLRCLPCHCARFLEDDLVRMQQPEDLHGHGLSPA